ncbi:uncharacterized protein [Porites lutea]|uniref:uncharacterized protein n=1 Tax=Porites lutea TaxID=51062 RepID=UPI003CC67FC5
MASLTDLPTACRFAVLHVTDDEDETGVGSKAGTSAKGKDAADGTNAAKAKKKRKKKKTRAKSNQGDTAKNQDEETEDHDEQILEHDEWSQWIEKDEQYVLSQFQRDLKEAVEASKQEQWQKIGQEQKAHVSTPEFTQENAQEKRKKEKPVVMTLGEFRMTVSADEVNASTNSGHDHFVSELDKFLDWQDDSGVLDANKSKERLLSEGATSDNLMQVRLHDEEKPSTVGKMKTGKLPASQKKSSRSESEPRSNQEQLIQPALEKKLLPATHEDQIQAELIQMKEELDKTSHELIELRKTKAEQLQIIDDLKKELSQVKRRNKQLCFILSQAEMKEKSELVMQIEELNEVKEQVVQLHGQLEQERSKNSALKIEINKSSGGRQRHGSSS